MTQPVDTHKRTTLKTAALGIGLAGVGQLSSAQNKPASSYSQMDAIELAQQIRSGHITALEALESAIQRADAVQALNPLVMRHEEQAMVRAKALSGMGRAAREERFAQAPLTGVPFALKDLGVALKGTITTNGSAFYKDAVAEFDSTLVQRYQASGLNIFAKTASPEFGMTATTESKLFGLTRNPWNPKLSSGGSSGGAAVAVATGILPVAHASDGGGSIRIPASHCGLFGLKPSRGRIPSGPTLLEGSLGLSCHHVISRSVRDSALMLELTQGAEHGSRTSPPSLPVMAALGQAPKRLKIVLLEDNPFGMPVHPDCLQAARSAAKLCESLGHIVETAPRPLLRPEVLGQMFSSMGIAMGTNLLYLVRMREKLLGRSAREDEFESIDWMSLQKAKGYTAEQLLAARVAFDQGAMRFDQLFEQYDVLLSPVTAAPAPSLGAMSLNQPFDDFVKSAIMASPFTSLFNMSGHPAMSVPIYWNNDGLPFGAHFAGPYAGEIRLLQLATQIEQAASWHQKRPSV